MAALGGVLTSLAGVAAIFLLNIESILVSGPILLAFAIIGLIFSLVSRDYWLVPLPLMQCTFPLIIFGLINVLNWGPMDAHTPVLIMSCIFTTFCVLVFGACLIRLIYRPLR